MLSLAPARPSDLSLDRPASPSPDLFGLMPEDKDIVMSDSEAGTPVNVPDVGPALQQPVVAGSAHVSAPPQPVARIAVHGPTERLEAQHDDDDDEGGEGMDTKGEDDEEDEGSEIVPGEPHFCLSSDWKSSSLPATATPAPAPVLGHDEWSIPSSAAKAKVEHDRDQGPQGNLLLS